MSKSVCRALAVCLAVVLPFVGGSIAWADDDDDDGGPAAPVPSNAGPADPDDPVVIYSDQPSVTVDYEVTGSAASATISYAADGAVTSNQNFPLPWRKSAVIWPPVQFVPLFATVAGVDHWVIQPNGVSRRPGNPAATGGSATCKISIGGKVVMQRTASGAYQSARCAVTIRFFD
jgi:hypothetical protein